MARAHHIYLVPGFFGFANLGELRYFAHVREFFSSRSRELGIATTIHVVRPHPTASLPKRAARILETVARTLPRRHGSIHLIGHSSGGLDARLLTSPNVSLPTDLEIDRFVPALRTVISVATPHHGTPVASFFTGLLGQKLLRLLSLSTIYVLRFGHLPIAALLQLGAVFARLDDLGVNSVLLDELFGRLLSDFSIGRRRAVQALFAAIAEDQSLLLQLTPEGMDVFNALTRDRPGVRYGSVVTRARRPGMRSTLATGLDPSAQASHAIYGALYRVAAQTHRPTPPALTIKQARVLRRAYGRLPTPKANDGVVPTRSQVWGEVIHAADADHLDVVGHFGDPDSTPPHFDWLTTGTGFTREKFDTLWTDIFEFLVRD